MSAERTIMDKFLEFLKYFFTKDLPEVVPQELLKERLFMVKFLHEQFMRSYIHYYQDNKIPIFEFTIYGEPGGSCMYEYVKPDDQEVLRNFNLNEFAEKLKEIVEEWDDSLIKTYDNDKEEISDFNAVKAWDSIKSNLEGKDNDKKDWGGSEETGCKDKGKKGQ
ncbi:MAG: hypothetical protein ACFFG0_01475 [Candidatus Thorarchaeota archaeon]